MNPTPAPSSREADFKVTAFDDRLEFVNKKTGETLVVLLSDVRRISAYKEDCFTFDTIVVCIESSGPRSLAVSEDVEGFSDFTKAMNRRFGISPGWYMKVIQPAFATNLTVLYEAPNRT